MGKGVKIAQRTSEPSSTPFRVVVPLRFPGLNEMIAAAKSHYHVYGEMAKVHVEAVKLAAQAACPVNSSPEHPRYNSSVRVSCTWVEPNRRRDIDNIQAGVKFILDGLHEANIIPNDSQKYVAEVRHEVRKECGKGYVEVIVEPVV
jgi:Holliday junction resolvase RusA-like endonuclease